MSKDASGASSINRDLIVGISNLKQKREQVYKSLEAETAVENKLQEEIAALKERLLKSQSNLETLRESRDAYTKTIEETELVCEFILYLASLFALPVIFPTLIVSYIITTNTQDNKIEESARNLMNVIKRETKSIQKNLNEK